MTDANMDLQTIVAQNLLKIGAVKLNTVDLFTWASGIKSPIYTDNRKTVGYPDVRKIIAEGLANLIKEKFTNVEVIGGVATAGISHATLVADILNLPMIYVRSKPKDHGSKQQLEGYDVSDKNVVLIDDLISTGVSVLDAVDAVKMVNGNVVGVFSIFTYELTKADENFRKQNLKYYSLTNYTKLIEVAVEDKYISPKDIEFLKNWHQKYLK